MKKQLTIEEKLQNALVPKEEQPYKIPNNWCWTYVSNVMNIVMGQSPKGVDTTQNVSDIPLVGGASDMGDLYPRVNKYTKKATKLSKEDDVILSIRATLGRPIFSDGVYCLGRGVAGISSNYLSKEFIRYYYICFESSLYSNATGTTFLQVTGSVLNKMLIPLPPLNEQQRIVERIESLFVKLDRAKELIENILAQFEQNKMAILHKAFTGELTAKWRKEKGLSKDTWKRKKISEVCTVVRGGSPRPAGSPQFYGGNIPFMKVADITNNDTPYINSTASFIKEAGLYKTRMVEANTLLLTNSGATLGVPAICTFKTTFNDGIAAFLNLNPKSVKYYYYFFISKTAELRGINKGAAQPNLNTKIIGEIMHNVPTIEEQQEIVNILDKLLAKYNKIKNLEQQLEKIELLKKAILAKAFRGELGTNNPDEESAENLLKEILAEK
ncbi:restriction endonuclease subunit S [Megamonas funiformis]